VTAVGNLYGDSYIDCDAVFGIKESLVREAPAVDDPARAAEAGLPHPFGSVQFDVTLLRADRAPLALEHPLGRQAG